MGPMLSLPNWSFALPTRLHGRTMTGSWTKTYRLLKNWSYVENITMPILPLKFTTHLNECVQLREGCQNVETICDKYEGKTGVVSVDIHRHMMALRVEVAMTLALTWIACTTCTSNWLVCTHPKWGQLHTIILGSLPWHTQTTSSHYSATAWHNNKPLTLHDIESYVIELYNLCKLQPEMSVSPQRTWLSTLKWRAVDTHNRNLTRPMWSVLIATKRGFSLQTAGQRAGERKVNAWRGGRARAKGKGKPQRETT